MNDNRYSLLLSAVDQRQDIEVLNQDSDRIMYSIDASIYQIIPQYVLIPKSTHALKYIIEQSSKYSCLITLRGAATGITGGCLTEGVVVDVSRSINKILSIDTEKKLATVQVGVVQDHLNDALKPFGLRLGPDTSTGNRATIGGMVGNNCAGARSLRYGMMASSVHSMRCILSDGTEVEIKEISWQQALKEKGPLGPIYHYLHQLTKDKLNDLAKPFKHLARRSSGYCLDLAINDKSVNLAKLITGSEGSLAAVVDVTVELSPLPSKMQMVLIPASSFVEASKLVQKLMQLNPLSLEFMDRKVMELGKSSKALQDQIDWLETDHEVLLIVELDHHSNSSKEVFDRFDHQVVNEQQKMDAVWALRKRGLGLLLSRRTYSRAIAFIEDVVVNIEKLPTFFEAFEKLISQYKLEVGVYGHIGAASLHIRPFIDLYSAKDRSMMLNLMQDVKELVKSCDGVMSGEHGDGKLRSWMNEDFFGKDVYSIYENIKQLFDPKGLLGKGNVIADQQLLDNLRTQGKDFPPEEPKTFLSFEKEGGFFLSADLCNGNGQCRKKKGLMCPSYQATNKEKDVTRGRAQALRSFILGDMDKQKGEEQVLDTLDLCLECKGCKKECPSNVDIAKMKQEFLHQYYKKHRRPIQSWLFGYFNSLYRIISFTPRISSWITQTYLFKSVLRSLGMTTDKPLPKPSRNKIYFKNMNCKSWDDVDLVIFVDTYMAYTKSSPIKGLIDLVNQTSLQIKMIQKSCCGRPLMSQGLLSQAKSVLEKTVDQLKPALERQIPILVLEPSCRSVFTDDIQGLIPEFKYSHLFVTPEQWLIRYLEKTNQRLHLKDKKEKIQVHRHCHSQSLESQKNLVSLLSGIEGLQWEILNEGCCGQAGSFGYVEKHRSVRDIAFEGLKKHATEGQTIIADGVSCRSQLETTTASTLSLVNWIGLHCDLGPQ